MNFPKYLLYGQPSDGPVDWFLNIEKLAKRCKERGWKIDLHSHPAFSQVIFVLQGRGAMMVEGDVLEFRSPCALVVPVNSIHGFDYGFNTDGWVVTIAEYCQKQMISRQPQLIELWETPAVVQLDAGKSSIDMVNNRIVNIERELLHKAPSYETVIESDLVSIMIELHRASLERCKAQYRYTDRQLKLVSDFRALVEEQLANNRRVPEYAAMLNVSAFQLRSACEAVVQRPPKEIVEDRLLTEAKRDLIFSSKSIEQIAYRLGFVDPSYFTRFFKKMEGEAPSSFRQSFRRKVSGEALPR